MFSELFKCRYTLIFSGHVCVYGRLFDLRSGFICLTKLSSCF